MIYIIHAPIILTSRIFGDLVGLKLPDICLTCEEKPWKTSPRKLVPTGDRTRARWVTGANATVCSTGQRGGPNAFRCFLKCSYEFERKREIFLERGEVVVITSRSSFFHNGKESNTEWPTNKITRQREYHLHTHSQWRTQDFIVGGANKKIF